MHDDKDKKEDKERGMPIIVWEAKDLKIKRARVVPKKGVDAYAVDRINRDLDQLGHEPIICKSDQDHIIKALKQAITVLRY